ncbi:MAG: sigma 54-interacting transcriptional regulator [bacterium]
MPRRARLSLPVMLMDATEGYLLCNASGELIDHNPAFARLAGLASEDPADLLPAQPAQSPVRMPQSVFSGEVVRQVVSLAVADEPTLLRLDAWPLTDDEGKIVAALGRVQLANQQDQATTHLPELCWGLALADELARRRGSQSFPGLSSLVGHGPDHQKMLRQVQAAIRARCSVVIAGPRGSGRHHLARIIHGGWQKGLERRAGLVPLDPASLPAEILARDFLGVAPGSHPAWNLPQGSTVLIENLAALEPTLQQAIAAAPSTVKIIGLIDEPASLHQLLPEFRALVEMITLHARPLRHRGPELPLLAQALLERIREGAAKRVDGFSPAALDILRMHDWPGNWHDLERAIRAAFENATGPMIAAADIPSEFQGALAGAWMQKPGDVRQRRVDPLENKLIAARRDAVEAAIGKHGPNKAAVARALGVSRPKLYRLLAELGLAEAEKTDDDAAEPPLHPPST